MPLLGMAAARGGVGQLATPRSLIELCVASAESGAQGLPALAKPCPGIEQAVRGLELGPLLPADWTTRLTPQSLSDWNALSARYSAAAPGERLSATALQVIARDLRPPAPSPSWWERFKAWVRRHLGPAINEPPQWLQHLSWAAGRGTQLAFLGVVLALVIAMIAVVTYRELRAEGLLGRRSRKPTATAAPQPSASVAPAESSEALDSLPVRERPVYLLRLILETLIRSHRLELAGPLASAVHLSRDRPRGRVRTLRTPRDSRGARPGAAREGADAA